MPGQPVQWTPAMDQAVVCLSVRQAAKVLGVSNGTVMRRRKALTAPGGAYEGQRRGHGSHANRHRWPNGPVKPRKIAVQKQTEIKSRVEQLKQWRAQGWTYLQIADEIGASHEGVRQAILRRLRQEAGVTSGTVKLCPICLRGFAAAPTGPVTCSRDCGGKLSGRSRLGKSRRWSATARARLAAKGRTENLKRGTPAAQRSPIAGPFETNQEAKIWYLRRLSDGREWVVRNLAKFCRDNPDLFAPSSWQRAYAGLRQVQASLAGNRSDSVSRYKGWTLSRSAEKPKIA